MDHFCCLFRLSPLKCIIEERLQFLLAHEISNRIFKTNFLIYSSYKLILCSFIFLSSLLSVQEKAFYKQI